MYFDHLCFCNAPLVYKLKSDCSGLNAAFQWSITQDFVEPSCTKRTFRRPQLLKSEKRLLETQLSHGH